VVVHWIGIKFWNEHTVVMITRGEERILPGQYERYGIDTWPRSTFVDVKAPRWTRSCKVCGLVQHTSSTTYGKST
jgi:hypothetical protein